MDSLSNNGLTHDTERTNKAIRIIENEDLSSLSHENLRILVNRKSVLDIHVCVLLEGERGWCIEN